MVDRESDKDSNKNESSESGEESDKGDDVEAEYLIEFQQTKKLQVNNSIE